MYIEKINNNTSILLEPLPELALVRFKTTLRERVEVNVGGESSW